MGATAASRVAALEAAGSERPDGGKERARGWKRAVGYRARGLPLPGLTCRMPACHVSEADQLGRDPREHVGLPCVIARCRIVSRG